MRFARIIVWGLGVGVWGLGAGGWGLDANAQPAPAPAIVSASTNAVETNTLAVAWTFASTNETGFGILVSNLTAATFTNYTDTNIVVGLTSTNGTTLAFIGNGTFEYWIYGCDAAGNGPYSQPGHWPQWIAYFVATNDQETASLSSGVWTAVTNAGSWVTNPVKQVFFEPAMKWIKF